MTKAQVPDLNWILAGLEKPGKTKVGLAKALGRSPSMVTALLGGKRELKQREVEVIARYLEVAAPQAVKIPSPYETEQPSIQRLPVMGEVAAGVWLDCEVDTFERYFVEVPLDLRFSTEAQFLLRVRGTSINKRAVSGSLVRCLDLFAAPRSPRTGDWVVARRMRNGSAEMTVKRLEILPDGEQRLWPDSTDPAFQTPIMVGEHEGDEVQITAFVLDFINPATKF